MNNLTVKEVSQYEIVFNNGVVLCSYHEKDVWEEHHLSMEHLSVDDFKGMKFNLSNTDCIEKVEGYGIRLKPINDHPVSIPGYGSNNGYYSSNLKLEIRLGKEVLHSMDITECQDIT